MFYLLKGFTYIFRLFNVDPANPMIKLLNINFLFCVH